MSTDSKTTIAIAMDAAIRALKDRAKAKLPAAVPAERREARAEEQATDTTAGLVIAILGGLLAVGCLGPLIYLLVVTRGAVEWKVVLLLAGGVVLGGFVCFVGGVMCSRQLIPAVETATRAARRIVRLARGQNGNGAPPAASVGP